MFENQIAEPQKLVRITTMARAMLEEARSAPCDAAGCERLKRIHDRVIAELSDVVSSDLYQELLTLSVSFDEVTPTSSEVRVAQAELVGWLEGLMTGLIASYQTSQNPGEGTGDQLTADAPGLYL